MILFKFRTAASQPANHIATDPAIYLTRTALINIQITRFTLNKSTTWVSENVFVHFYGVVVSYRLMIAYANLRDWDVQAVVDDDNDNGHDDDNNDSFFITLYNCIWLNVYINNNISMIYCLLLVHLYEEKTNPYRRFYASQCMTVHWIHFLHVWNKRKKTSCE